MRISKRTMLFLLVTGLTFLLTGCQYLQKISQQPMVEVPKKQHINTDARKFEKPIQEGPTVIESTIELSKKYVKQSEELAQLRQ